MEENKARYARKTPARTLADAIPGADIFLGLSGPGAMKQAWVATMGPQPLVLALANPTPEIRPEEVKAVRPDAIIATGRSDYPNQVNNVLCFPFIFRGALDVGATRITEEMARMRARHCRAGAGRAVRRGGDGVRRRGPVVRSGVHHPQAVRPAPHRQDRARRREVRHGQRRGRATDHGLRGLSPAADQLRVPLRLRPEAGVLQRGRTRGA